MVPLLGVPLLGNTKPQRGTDRNSLLTLRARQVYTPGHYTTNRGHWHDAFRPQVLGVDAVSIGQKQRKEWKPC